MILAVAAVVGFFYRGRAGADGRKTRSAFIGLGIGGLFSSLLFPDCRQKTQPHMDGVSGQKDYKEKGREGSRTIITRSATEYAVNIRLDDGKVHRLTASDDDTVFNYYQIGDRVRRHAGLNSYEKYDKSRDKIIFCNACATLCDINDDFCFRCKCPLLK